VYQVQVANGQQRLSTSTITNGLLLFVVAIISKKNMFTRGIGLVCRPSVVG